MNENYCRIIISPNISMNFFIALGITEDVSTLNDGLITETENFLGLNVVGLPKKISIFYIGY